MMKITKTRYKLKCLEGGCGFKREFEGSKEDLQEAINDHLHESPDDDYGYKNWGHEVAITKTKVVTLDWSGRG